GGCGDAPAPKAPPPAADFKAAAVEVREIDLTYSAEAVIEAVRQSTVSAQISGRIVELRFDVGACVQPVQGSVRLDRAEAVSKKRQTRLSAMLAGAGQAATERSFATIVAPCSGVVAARHVELGEMAVPGKPLMTGFDPATLRAVANVPQAPGAAIQASGRARIEVPA